MTEYDTVKLVHENWMNRKEYLVEAMAVVVVAELPREPWARDGVELRLSNLRKQQLRG